MNGVSVLIIILAVLVVGIYVIYVNLIQKKNKALEAFSSIDVQLKRRYDLIPNLLKIANKFMNHEKELLTKITELRSAANAFKADPSNAKEMLELDKLISQKMQELKISLENYPELKSDKTMLEAMQAYDKQEEYIAAARRFYNAAVLSLNNSVEIFPSSIVAGWLKINKMPFFEANQSEKQNINANDFF